MERATCRRRGAPRSLLVALLAFCAAVPGFASRSEAALIGGYYELAWDENVDKTGNDTTDVRKFRQTVDVRFHGFLSPVVQNQFELQVVQEVNSNAPDVTRFLPTMDLGFSGTYWELKSGAKRTHENSDEPGKNPKINSSYFVEFLYRAPKKVPDLKAKYTLDTDFQEGNTDSERRGITLSSAYSPIDWLSAKGDYARNQFKDFLRAGADTEDEKINGAITVRHMIGETIKVSAEYDVETSRSATLQPGGGASAQRETQTHDSKNTFAFRPFRETDVTASYDFNLRQDLITGEHNLTANSKATVAQRVGNPLTLRADFARAVNETRHSAGDNVVKAENSWSFDGALNLNRQINITAKYQDKRAREDHFGDGSKDSTSSTITSGGTWSGELTRFLKASASYDRTDTFAFDFVKRAEFKTTVDKKYSLKGTLNSKLMNFTAEPSYDITLKDDRVSGVKSEQRDVKVRVAARPVLTRNFEGKFDHTYDRLTNSLLNNIQRSDTTNVNMTWKDPFPGWSFGIDLTRNATDTSGDDSPARIQSTYGVKGDYAFRMLSVTWTYKYDRKSDSASSESVDAKVAWTAPQWDAALTYKFTKTFSEILTESYAISLLFKYNL